MGIERALRAAFGAALAEVQQVDAIDTSASVAAVDAHLDMLRPAIQSYGGSVQARPWMKHLLKQCRALCNVA